MGNAGKVDITMHGVIKDHDRDDLYNREIDKRVEDGKTTVGIRAPGNIVPPVYVDPITRTSPVMSLSSSSRSRTSSTRWMRYRKRTAGRKNAECDGGRNRGRLRSWGEPIGAEPVAARAGLAMMKGTASPVTIATLTTRMSADSFGVSC